MDSVSVKCQRMRLGLTQSDVAKEMGVATRSYCNMENGLTKMTDAEKVHLMNVLKMSLRQMNDWLYDGVLPIDDVF